MRLIPIKNVSNQNFIVTLNNILCKININTFSDHLYFSMEAQNVSIATNTICLNKVPLIIQKYLEFSGNFIFFDTQGNLNPIYTGLGSRYILIFLTGEEFAQLF